MNHETNNIGSLDQFGPKRYIHACKEQQQFSFKDSSHRQLLDLQ